MIILHISGHCIEKAARKKYEELVMELLREENRKKEEELEFLLEFLKRANFSELRRRGFDGREEMFVMVKKEGNEFVVEKICSS
ncbi:MAG: hypothetical protein QXR27_05110 [Archaeoglobaceae archaeon]